MDIISGSVMKPLKSITVIEFKGRCSELIEQVRRTRQPLLITHKGKPLAQILPYTSRKMRGKKAQRVEPSNPLKGSILYQGDLVSPIDVEWDVMPIQVLE
jgi:prevent-host-death family protein